MTPRRHAQLARMLIKACGGLEEAARACRVGVSQLSNIQTPGSGQFMPADVICDLEAYCGERIYSGALFEVGPGSTAPRQLMDEIFDVSETAVELQREARAAVADGELNERERRDLQARMERLRIDLAEAEQALNAGSDKTAPTG